MKEQSELNYEPLYNLLKTHGLADLVNCELDEIINCVKSLDRPTSPVGAKTAEEILNEYLLDMPLFGYVKTGDAIKAMEAYHAQFTPSESNWIPNLSEMDGQLVDKEVEISRLTESLKTIYSLAKPGSDIYDICDKTLNQKK